MDYNQSEREAAATLRLGKKVERATANPVTGDELFAVESGDCLITLLVGEVTSLLQTQSATYKLVLDVDTGSDTDMSGTLNVNADEVGTLYTLHGTGSTGMQVGSSGSCIGPHTPIVVSPGGIDITVSTAHSGEVKWTLWYIPLAEGAYITAS